MTYESINPLLSLSKTQLVVLAACNSFRLGSSLVASSVLAAQGNVSVDGYEQWATLFYSLLFQGKSLSEIFPTVQVAASQSGTSISILSRRDLKISVRD
ncbi:MULTISPECIES: hypothetical protein [Bradyrhizobium]|uniref:hypothetical protein n=1 Tax=Bradyrhizobium TaxID=374 RepID=UPI001144729A|nr:MULTISPECIES: hypothetical protein [Bradyrhizobium]UFW51123.1 CHAT domain-containing protein [Bradyrhizobium arachidis]